jgi:hypothetical protein
MTPKEKAIQLYNKFYGIPLYIKTIKECCYIAVDEILESGKDVDEFNDSYWLSVKEEINKL